MTKAQGNLETIQLLGKTFAQLETRIASLSVLFVTLLAGYLYFGVVAPRSAKVEVKRLQEAQYQCRDLRKRLDQLRGLMFMIVPAHDSAKGPFVQTVRRFQDAYAPILNQVVSANAEDRSLLESVTNAVDSIAHLQDEIGRSFFFTDAFQPLDGSSLFSDRMAAEGGNQRPPVPRNAIDASENLDNLIMLDGACRALADLFRAPQNGRWADNLRSAVQSGLRQDDAPALASEVPSTLLEALPVHTVLSTYSSPRIELARILAALKREVRPPFSVVSLSDIDRLHDFIGRRIDETVAVFVPATFSVQPFGASLPRAFVLGVLPLGAALVLFLIAEQTRRLLAIVSFGLVHCPSSSADEVPLTMGWFGRQPHQADSPLDGIHPGWLFLFARADRIRVFLGGVLGFLLIIVPVAGAIAVGVSVFSEWDGDTPLRQVFSIAASVMMLLCTIPIFADQFRLWNLWLRPSANHAERSARALANDECVRMKGVDTAPRITELPSDTTEGDTQCSA